tara:strand:- start:54048 stop:54833 length:786 start_codon:yes stop_codon:yes gene_type:complete
VEKQIWDEYQIDLQSSGHWKIGPLHLWVTRFKNEWRISSLSNHDPDDRTIEIEVPFKQPLSEDLETNRFGGKETTPSIRFTPVLADRPVVIRPEMPFYLPSTEEVTIYVSTPLWLNITVEPHSRKLLQIPILRLSDSWFGPDPTEGELCYAARTKAKLRFEDLTLIQYRALTKIVLKNSSSKQLFLERIKVPVNNLSLYSSKEAGLLTETITIIKEDDQVEMKMRLEKPIESEFGKPSKIAMPREPLQKNIFLKAINTLIG